MIPHVPTHVHCVQDVEESGNDSVLVILFPSFGTYSTFLPVFQEPITIIGQKAHLDFSIDAHLEAR